MPHATPPVELHSTELLQRVTAAAFNQRRKTIANSLHALLTAAELQQLQIAPTLRAENLSLYQFATIANYLHSK